MNLILLRSNELKDTTGSSAHDDCAGSSPKRHKGAATKVVAHLDGTDARARHIVQHLRKRTADRVSVGIINGPKGKAIVTVDDDTSESTGELEGSNTKKGGASVTLELTFDPSGNNGQSAQPETTLVLAIPQPKRLQKLWSVISQMGVTRIILIRAKLSPYGTHCKSSKFTEESYRALIEEGMAQGAHTREVRVDVEVDEVVSPGVLERLGLRRNANGDGDGNTTQHQARLFLDCGDESGMVVPPAREVVMEACTSFDANASSVPPSAVLAIGPERGWTEEESRLFQDEGGFRMASLGPSILRVDVAVVAGLAVVSAALDAAASSK